MNAMTSTDWSLAARPVGTPKMSDFGKRTAAVAEPAAGEIQVQNSFLSVDPYMRGRMYDRPSYVPPFQIGETMTGGAVGRVTASGHPDYKIGDLIVSMAGWRSAWTAKPEMAMATKMPETGLPDSALLGVAGMPGLTAYAGILRVAELKPSDTVFVSGAAGAVGATVVQIAKIKGAAVIGSAGGPGKCAFVKSLGADQVIDYKQAHGLAELTKSLAAAAPKGIDVYFDNVGGDHLAAAIECARPNARFALCGMISQYNDTAPSPGPHNIIQLVGKQIKMQGFIVSFHQDMQAAFLKDMAGWIGEGKMKYEETVLDGVDKMPDAFLGLFTGANTGKMLVKV
jgi:NADPH-dependent curcumin reductase CurA